MTRRKVYTLDDGSKVTALQVADETNISITTIRNRLLRTNERDKVYAKAMVSSGNSRVKVFILSDGSEWTVKDIMKRTGATQSCVGARLHSTRDVDKILAPKHKPGEGSQLKITTNIKNRMCFDGREHWLLLAANT